MKILSFDIEDWFHIFDPAYTYKPDLWEKLPSRVEENTDRILELLGEKDLKATFFCLGWVAQKHPGLIRKISAQGHQLAAHSYYHRKTASLSKEEFRNDTRRVLDILEDLGGKKVTAYRAPGFSFNRKTKWAFQILHELGITTDSSLESGYRMWKDEPVPESPFVIDGGSFRMKEFPTRTVHILGKRLIYSGSGYFRLLPYSYVKKRFRRSDYEMSYFHPRDFDNSIHRYFKYRLLLQLRYRIGTNVSYNNLQQMLTEFSFVSMEMAERKTDWEKTKTITLFNGGDFH